MLYNESKRSFLNATKPGATFFFFNLRLCKVFIYLYLKYYYTKIQPFRLENVLYSDHGVDSTPWSE